jgi:dipeptidase D
LAALFTLVGGSSKTANFCNGLIGNLNNRLALFIQRIAQEKFNHPTKLSQVHAVLEIGEIAKHYPNITAVSVGANIENPHTTKERVEIKSILYTYELIKEIVQTIK